MLKKNYTMLCCTLPQEFKQTIFKMKQLLRGHDDVLNKLTDLPTVDLINEKIIEILMLLIKSDTDAINFCDVMENLVNSESSTATIEALRNGMKVIIIIYIVGYVYDFLVDLSNENNMIRF